MSMTLIAMRGRVGLMNVPLATPFSVREPPSRTCIAYLRAQLSAWSQYSATNHRQLPQLGENLEPPGHPAISRWNGRSARPKEEERGELFSFESTDLVQLTTMTLRRAEESTDGANQAIRPKKRRRSYRSVVWRHDSQPLFSRPIARHSAASVVHESVHRYAGDVGRDISSRVVEEEKGRIRPRHQNIARRGEIEAAANIAPITSVTAVIPPRTRLTRGVGLLERASVPAWSCDV